MTSRILLLVGISSCGLISACTTQSDIDNFYHFWDEINNMPIEELESSASEGNLSAMYRLSSRECAGIGDKTLCNQELLHMAQEGHPRAMDELSMRMTSDKLGIYNPRESYIWLKTRSKFTKPIGKLSNSDFVRSYQLLDQSSIRKRIEYLEGILSETEVSSAKLEAETRAKELWQKLQTYCREWKDQDYVCLYKFVEPTSN